MQLKLRLLVLLLVVGISTKTKAQDSARFRVYSIDLSLNSLNPTLDNVSFSDLRDNSRFGNLFATPPGDTISQDGSVSVNSTNIAITLKPTDSLSRYHVSVLFASETIQSTWGTWSQDTISTRLSGRYENFLLGLGYHYELKQGRIFKLTTGLQIMSSFPVSSVTTERYDDSQEVNESDLFGHKRVGFRSSIPVTAYLKIFKPVGLRFSISPSFHTFQLDGIKRSKFWVANEIGLRFYLK